eukprot:gene9743-1753_t
MPFMGLRRWAARDPGFKSAWGVALTTWACYSWYRFRERGKFKLQRDLAMSVPPLRRLPANAHAAALSVAQGSPSGTGLNTLQHTMGLHSARGGGVLVVAAVLVCAEAPPSQTVEGAACRGQFFPQPIRAIHFRICCSACGLNINATLYARQHIFAVTVSAANKSAPFRVSLPDVSPEQPT